VARQRLLQRLVEHRRQLRPQEQSRERLPTESEQRIAYDHDRRGQHRRRRCARQRRPNRPGLGARLSELQHCRRPNGHTHGHQYRDIDRYTQPNLHPNSNDGSGNTDRRSAPDINNAAGNTEFNAYRAAEPNTPGDRYLDTVGHTKPAAQRHLHAHQHVEPRTEQHADRFGDAAAYGHRDGNADGYAESNRYANADRKCHSAAKPYPHGKRHITAKRYTDADRNRKQYGNPYPNRPTDPHSNKHLDEHPNQHGNKHSDPYPDQYADKHPNQHSDQHPNTHAQPHVDEYTDHPANQYSGALTNAHLPDRAQAGARLAGGSNRPQLRTRFVGRLGLAARVLATCPSSLGHEDRDDRQGHDHHHDGQGQAGLHEVLEAIAAGAHDQHVSRMPNRAEEAGR